MAQAESVKTNTEQEPDHSARTRTRAFGIFYSESESRPVQNTSNIFPGFVLHAPLVLSQRSLITLQGPGVGERSNSEWACHWSLNTFWSQIQSSRGTKFSILRIPASGSVGAGLKNQKNASYVIPSHRVKGLPHAGYPMPVEGPRGDRSARYFTHFEMVRMMRLAACMLEKTKSCMETIFLCFIFYFHIKSSESKNRNLGCKLPVFHSGEFFSKINDKAQLLMRKSIWRANMRLMQQAASGAGSENLQGGGLSIKWPANLTYPHFQKHDVFRLLFFPKRALLSLFERIRPIFKVYQESQRGPGHLPCNCPVSRRPERPRETRKASRTGPKGPAPPTR